MTNHALRLDYEELNYKEDSVKSHLSEYMYLKICTGTIQTIFLNLTSFFNSLDS